MSCCSNHLLHPHHVNLVPLFQIPKVEGDFCCCCDRDMGLFDEREEIAENELRLEWGQAELCGASLCDRSFVLLRVLHLRDQLAVVSCRVWSVRVHTGLLLCPLFPGVSRENVLVLVEIEVFVLVKEGF